MSELDKRLSRRRVLLHRSAPARNRSWNHASRLTAWRERNRAALLRRPPRDIGEMLTVAAPRARSAPACPVRRKAAPPRCAAQRREESVSKCGDISPHTPLAWPVAKFILQRVLSISRCRDRRSRRRAQEPYRG